MKYIVLYTDGSMIFYSRIPKAEQLGTACTVFIASGLTTLQNITEWISNNYADTPEIKSIVN